MSPEARGLSRFLGRSALVVGWSVTELLRSPRTLAMMAVVASPVGLALAYRVALGFRMTAPAGFGVFQALAAGVAFPFVAPMLSLFYASGLVRDDLEAGTLPYYLTRPVRRFELLSGKMLASFALSLGLLLPSLVLTYYLALAPEGLAEVGARFPGLARTLAAAALGLAAYNGIFALAGTVLRRPLLAGLFFIFGWQAAATFVPGRARFLTVAHYVSSLLPPGGSVGGLSGLFGERSSAPGSVGALFFIAALTHGLALVAFSRKEVR